MNYRAHQQHKEKKSSFLGALCALCGSVFLVPAYQNIAFLKTAFLD